MRRGACSAYRLMRIAMISTPFVAVPPPRYGGTELIVSELVNGLAEAGHEVTLFATGDSEAPPGVTLRARFDEARWPPQPYTELDHTSWAMEQILADAQPYDVIHAHVPSALTFAAMLDAPLVYTVHHDGGDEMAKLASIYERSRAQFIAISARQRALQPHLAGATIIHHGLDPARYTFGAGDGGYCGFLGRYSHEKAPHVAVDVARAAGLPIRLAGKPHWPDLEYFEREVAPRFSRDGVTNLGELGGAPKREFLARAAALLFPIAWEEPFGLVMIEAMLSGTPVLALPRGAAPEVVEDGVTGFLCRDADEMSERLRDIGSFDRNKCRQRALERWTTARMVRDHLALYEQLQPWVRDVRAAKTVA
jgi:glycosyltransferase involved in cell wall biosynthesis